MIKSPFTNQELHALQTVTEQAPLIRAIFQLKEKIAELEKELKTALAETTTPNLFAFKKATLISLKKLTSELIGLENKVNSLRLQKGDRGEKGDKGDTTIVEKVIEKTEVIKEQPIITEIVKNVENDASPDEIRNKLELLTGDERLDASAIKNLPEVTKEITKGFGGIPGLLTYVSGTKKGYLKGLNFIGATHSIVNGLDTLTFSGSGTTVTEEVVSFSGSTGTLAHTPTAGGVRLFRGGIRQQNTVDYTISGATITLVTPASSGETFLADYTY